jgi:hypothetical protein
MLGGVVSGVNQFRHAVSDGDGGRAIAIRVFVFSYYTIFYVLNDRKEIG